MKSINNHYEIRLKKRPGKILRRALYEVGLSLYETR